MMSRMRYDVILRCSLCCGTLPVPPCWKGIPEHPKPRPTRSLPPLHFGHSPLSRIPAALRVSCIARMAEEGFLAFVQEKRAQLPPGAEEPDWEDEWDDLTLAQKAPYVEKTTAHPAPSPPKAKPAASSPRPAPAASSPRPAPVASTSKAASSSSGAGPSGSKPASLESPSGKTKRPKSGVRKPRSAFELFASQQRKTSRNDDADDEAPDLGQARPPTARAARPLVPLSC